MMPVNKKLIIPWMLALVFLIIYYQQIILPLQRSFIESTRLVRQGQDNEAMVAFDGMIKANPYYAPGYANRWYLRLKMGNQGQAWQDFKLMYEIHAKNGEIHTPRRLMYGKIKDPSQAIAFYNQQVEERLLLHFLNNNEHN